MTWAAVQDWLSQPWVLSLGVWIIAVSAAIGVVVEMAKIVTQAARELRTAIRAARDRRYWQRHEIKRVKVDGRYVKQIVSTDPGGR